MPRLRTPNELLPLPEALRPLVERGEILDVRASIPVHTHYGEPRYSWPRRSLDDIAGLCIHHSASHNDDPVRTARYHSSPGEHITRDSRGCPGLTYGLVITEREQPPLLVNDLEHATWSQGGKRSSPGDENRHLLALLVMGKFTHERAPIYSQLCRLWQLVHQLQTALNLPPCALFGHFDFGKATCPGPQIERSIRYRRGRGATPGLVTSTDWQRALVGLGCDLGDYGPGRDGVDGVWGAKSSAALKAYQRERGIRITGECDPITGAVLQRDILARLVGR